MTYNQKDVQYNQKQENKLPGKGKKERYKMKVTSYNLMKKGNACTLRESANYETEDTKILNPQAIVDFCNDIFGMKDLSSEKLIVTCVNTKNTPKAIFEFSGGYDSVQAPAGVIFTNVLLSGCPRFFITHNHPSGDPTPSREDDNFTQDLYKGAQILGIQLVDHVVIAEDGNYSYQEHGKI